MIEVSLIGVRFSIQPITAPDGSPGKQVNFMHDKSDTTWFIPMAQNSADKMGNGLLLSNEELEKTIEKDLLAAKLEIPEGGIDLDEIRNGPKH